jgi:hypothetical protein
MRKYIDENMTLAKSLSTQRIFRFIQVDKPSPFPLRAPRLGESILKPDILFFSVDF